MSGAPLDTETSALAESRLPMAAAVVVAMILIILLPSGERPGPAWLLPLVLGLLLVALIVGDPGTIDRRSDLLRAVSIGLVSVLVLASLWAAAQLIDALVNGGSETRSAGDLLSAGGVVWAFNWLAFALLYWELDGGGAAARAHSARDRPDFAFPQDMNPALAPARWRPTFIDYLYLGYTNATAFSPTDAMPMARWAKIAMTVQSLTSLAILALVIARAVNVFT